MRGRLAAAGVASIGCTWRCNATATRASRAAPPRPPRQAPCARTVPRWPVSIAARRTSTAGSLEAAAIASSITLSSAPWRNSPTKRRCRKSCSCGVPRLKSAPSLALRNAAAPSPATVLTSPRTASTSREVRTYDYRGPETNSFTPVCLHSASEADDMGKRRRAVNEGQPARILGPSHVDSIRTKGAATRSSESWPALSSGNAVETDAQARRVRGRLQRRSACVACIVHSPAPHPCSAPVRCLLFLVGLMNTLGATTAATCSRRRSQRNDQVDIGRPGAIWLYISRSHVTPC